MATRDISNHIKQIYGFGISESIVSQITNNKWYPCYAWVDPG